VEVVTAAGERLTLDKDSHPDLFWAARGAGPAFCAVATRFHLDVFPRPQAIVSATFVYPIARAPEVIAWLETYRERQPTNLELVLLFAHDTKSGVGGRDSQQCIVSAVCFAGDDAEAHRVLDALGAGAPAQDLLHAVRYRPTTVEGLLAADLASLPIRHCVETFWVNGAAEPLHALARHFRDAPSAHTLVYANYRADPRLRGDGAYSVMAPLFIFSAAAWTEAQDDAGNQRWSDDLVTTLEPYTAGAYINEVEFTRHPARARRCFSHASWERLAEVNSRYDPTGMFTPPFRQRTPAG
jgi:FAD/FMN-containing dehydrogenase